MSKQVGQITGICLQLLFGTNGGVEGIEGVALALHFARRGKPNGLVQVDRVALD
jgi:hypothetical protein